MTSLLAPTGSWRGRGEGFGGGQACSLPLARLCPPHSLHFQVAALCFVLVLGSLVPCLPAFSSGSQTVKEDPMAADSVYTASQSECPKQGCPPPTAAPTSGQKTDASEEPGLGLTHSTFPFCRWGN